MPNNYILLERIELNASAASVTFANIPQTGYTDLKVVISARGDVAATNDDLLLKINNDNTSSRYTTRSLYGNGASAASAVSGYNSFAYLGVIDAATATASTFANHELYIPNAFGSNQKSYSVDGVQENNATTAFAYMLAGLYNQTTSISSLVFLTASGNFLTNSTFSLYGLAATGTTPAIAPKASGGNRIDYDGTYWIHTFNTNGTFTPQTGLTCDYLVVAGGGGAGARGSGRDGGGGGGAGGYRNSVTGETSGANSSPESKLTLAVATNYSVVVGAGGAGSTTNANGTSGADSTFSTITSTGGGGGGGANSAGLTGGSGGGACNDINQGSARTGANGTALQGLAGGNASFGTNAGQINGGGGGGAGVVGSNSTTTQNGGVGGAGLNSSITGTSVGRAGGGGGAGNGGNAAGATTFGGGAADGGSGSTNTGGGGSARQNTVATAGAGGSGIVIIRYLA